MSEKRKDCAKHRREDICRRVCCCVAMLVLVALITIFVIWLVLRPTKPSFYLREATVYELNLSSTPPTRLTTILQVTIASRNPNRRIGIYYNRMHVYATYQWQQVTLPARMLPWYEHHKGVSVSSPYLSGTNVPISPYLSEKLQRDRVSGMVLLHVKIHGKVRWKVGSWTSGIYHLDVSCPALLSYNRRRRSKFQQMPAYRRTCTVDV